MPKPMSPRNLIIFFIPQKKVVDGGIMSIFSLCKESRKLESMHHAEVVISIYPGHPTYKKNDLFPNDERIYSFDEVVKKYPKLDSLLIHFPNAAAKEVYDGLLKYDAYIKAIPSLHINVLNQNIQHMPTMGAIANLFNLTPTVTQTTAHDSYATQEVSDMYALPLYHMSVFIDSEQYDKRAYQDKRNLIAYSPDEHPLKAKIIKQLQTRFTAYEFIEIRGMTYVEYKAIVSQAKFMITFGEGFDGYLIESAFSGGIPFAVYSADFFPSSDFQNYRTIYDDYDEMLKNIVADIESLDSAKPYTALTTALQNRLKEFYNFDHYLAHLKDFYAGKVTFQPKPDSLMKLLLKVFGESEATLEKRDLLIEKYETDIRSYLHDWHQEQLASRQKDRTIAAIHTSLSWKVTKPLRLLSRLLSGKRTT